jgi:hypothetical protein
MFAPAVKTESKLRMAIAAPSGSGKTYTETLKARLKALGYASIPGKPAERVAAYRRLRADMGAVDDLMAVAGQPPLVTVDATQPGSEYQD